MSAFVQGLTWVVFVIAIGIVCASFVLLVAAMVKTCARAPRAPAPPQHSDRSIQPEPVCWTMAVAVTNPDDTTVMAVRDPQA